VSRVSEPPNDAAHVAGHAVLFAPVETLLGTALRPYPIPVLGQTPARLFDSVPPGLCDDLIGDNWTEAELRYRLGRLAVRRHTFTGDHQLTCAPSGLSSGSRSTALTVSQYRVLSILIRAQRSAVPREAIAAVLADASRATGSRAVDMCISRLRRKLQAVTVEWREPPRIVARRKIGYLLA
jgi:hypothetical protein